MDPVLDACFFRLQYIKRFGTPVGRSLEDFLFQRKYADFRNFYGKCFWKNLRSSKEDFEKGCAIFETSLETS